MKENHHPPGDNPKNFRVSWGEEMSDAGFALIPNLLIDRGSELDITDAEFRALCQIIRYKDLSVAAGTDEEWPWASMEKEARKSGKSERAFRDSIISLEKKGLLRRTWIGGKPSVMDLSGLRLALISLPVVPQEPARKRQGKGGMPTWKKDKGGTQVPPPNSSSTPELTRTKGRNSSSGVGRNSSSANQILEQTSLSDAFSQNPPSTRDRDRQPRTEPEPEQGLGFASTDTDPVQPSQPEPELLHGETQPIETVEAWPNHTNLKELRQGKAQQLAPPSSEEREALQRRVELLIAAGCSGNMAERIALCYDDRDCAAFAAQARCLTRQRRENGKQGPSAAQMFGAAVKGTWGPDYEFLEEEEDIEARRNRLYQQQDQATEEEDKDEEDREKVIGAARADLPWRKTHDG